MSVGNGSFDVALPDPFGPRNWGQSPAKESAVSTELIKQNNNRTDGMEFSKGIQ
jgi:hypothetical protein